MRSASGHVQRVDIAGLRPDEVETEHGGAGDREGRVVPQCDAGAQHIVSGRGRNARATSNGEQCGGRVRTASRPAADSAKPSLSAELSFASSATSRAQTDGRRRQSIRSRRIRRPSPQSRIHSSHQQSVCARSMSAFVNDRSLARYLTSCPRADIRHRDFRIRHEIVRASSPVKSTLLMTVWLHWC